MLADTRGDMLETVTKKIRAAGGEGVDAVGDALKARRTG